MANRTTDEQEQKRLELQASLDAQKSALERNKLGQFATPTALAREIVAHGARLLGDQPIEFLDPAIGTGSFYSALSASVSADRIRSALGFEIDPHYADPAQKLWKGHALEMRLSDFTKVEPSVSELANLIICNPPYVRHHHIGKNVKEGLQTRTEAACGVCINGLSGLYCYFLGLAHRWMKPEGIAGWLIPSEFMDVNYGQQLKQYLLTKVELLHIHRFDPADAQFTDALVSSAVVWIRNKRPSAGHSVRFTFGGTLANPVVARDVQIDELRSESKWTRYPLAQAASHKSSVTLGDLFTISRGIATGDNSFFIMTPDQIAERELPMECFTPVLPSTRYIEGNEIQADEVGNPIVGKQLFLLDTKLPEEQIAARYPALWAYLQTGRRGETPVAERYLCRNKKLWYAQENRPAAPILCTYMGRSRQGTKPFRFILNHSKATACNVYLMLYPRATLAKAIAREPALLRKIWTFLNEISAEELQGNGRVYGGGLHKLEPKELRNVSVDGLIQSLSPLYSFPGYQDDLFHVAAE